MRKFLLIVISAAPLSLFAQRLSITGFGGVSNYQGDFQEKRFTTEQSHAAFGLGIQYDLVPHVVLRSGFTYGKISGDDKLNKDPQLVKRNLNFSSQILEFNISGEYDLFSLDEKRFTPYAFGGLAIFGFDPYTYDTLGTRYYLQPLGTEGQGLSTDPGNKPYHRVQISIPFGLGFKFRVNEQMTLGYEIGLRKTFTDYLDDLSNRYPDAFALLQERGPKAVELSYRGGELKDGNPVFPAAGSIRGGSKYKDWYYFQGITIAYRIKGLPFSRSSGGGYNRRQLDCPRNVY
jgi:hypothetical protein